MIEVMFWSSSALVLYSYFVYPLLVNFFAAMAKPTATLSTSVDLPSVDVIIAAYNEESCIKQRIENLLAQDYSGDIRFLIGSDGSKDSTGKIIKAFPNEHVVPFVFEDNRGKISVLNDLVAASKADILVLSDANTMFDKDAISVLVNSFSDDIGAVSGELILETEDGNQNSDGLYWRYEQTLKRAESKLGTLLGANGAIYAIKRELYQPLPMDTVVDDFCIVMNVRKQSFRVTYNHKAVAREEVAPTLKDEYGRRVRIGLGNYKALMSHLWALSPFRGLLSWCYWSHKVLRWFAPHFMLIALITNLLLIDQPFFALTASIQIVFYSLAIYGQYLINRGTKVHPLTSIVSFFVYMNVALAHGFCRYIAGTNKGTWERTNRQGE